MESVSTRSHKNSFLELYTSDWIRNLQCIRLKQTNNKQYRFHSDSTQFVWPKLFSTSENSRDSASRTQIGFIQNHKFLITLSLFIIILRLAYVLSIDMIIFVVAYDISDKWKQIWKIE